MHSLPRTALYGLPLLGVGTPNVECFRSYVQRLAMTHSMSTRSLVSMATGVRYMDNRLRDGVVHNSGSNNRRVLELMEGATGVSLTPSTFARFSHLLPAQELTRGVFEDLRFCPVCVRQPQDVAARHGRLLWEVAAVDACPQHKVRLKRVVECGAPASDRLRIDVRPNLPGICGACGSIGFDCRGDAEPAGETSIWIAAEVGDLLALDDRVVAGLGMETLREGLADVVRVAFGGQPVRASREAHLARASVLTWLQGRSRPTLGCLVQLALAARANLTGIFLGHYEESRRPVPSSAGMAPRQRPYKRVDWPHVQRELEQALMGTSAPESLTAFAKRVGVDQCDLRNRYPTECASLTSKAKSFRDEELSKSYHAARMAYSEAASALVDEGKAITANRLQRMTGLWVFRKAGESARGVAMRTVIQTHRAGWAAADATQQEAAKN